MWLVALLKESTTNQPTNQKKKTQANPPPSQPKMSANGKILENIDTSDRIIMHTSKGYLISGSLLVKFGSMLQPGWESSHKPWDGVNIFSFYIIRESCYCLCLEKKLMA